MTDEEKCRVPPGIYHARIVSVESGYREALHDKEFEEVEKIEEIIEPAGIYFQLVYVLSRPDDPEEYIWSSVEDVPIVLNEVHFGFPSDWGCFSRFLQCFGLSQEDVLDRGPECLIGKVSEVQVIPVKRCTFCPLRTEVPSRDLIFGRDYYF